MRGIDYNPAIKLESKKDTLNDKTFISNYLSNDKTDDIVFVYDIVSNHFKRDTPIFNTGAKVFNDFLSSRFEQSVLEMQEVVDFVKDNLYPGCNSLDDIYTEDSKLKENIINDNVDTRILTPILKAVNATYVYLNLLEREQETILLINFESNGTDISLYDESVLNNVFLNDFKLKYNLLDSISTSGFFTHVLNSLLDDIYMYRDMILNNENDNYLLALNHKIDKDLGNVISNMLFMRESIDEFLTETLKISDFVKSRQ